MLVCLIFVAWFELFENHLVRSVCAGFDGERATGINLRTVAMAAGTLSALVARQAAPADVALAEGVMGLFDGVAQAGQTARGATADLAALFGWPVLLVLDVAAASRDGLLPPTGR